MHYDMSTLSGSQKYRVLGGCVTPRPIAWVTSLSADRILNVAPFSFFNVVGNEPPMVVLGFVAHPRKRLKDTAANIRDTGEFVVNLVGEPGAQMMNQTSLDVEPGIDEGELVDVRRVPSVAVAPPRIENAPASFECRSTHFIMTGENQAVVLAEVLHAHIQDQFVLDAKKIVIDVPAMQLIARLHGAGWYSRQSDMFEMLRPMA